MPAVQHLQFCALARAAEILGERWTFLIIRELLLGPKRFTDLRARLDGVSTSVLAERLSRLENVGLLRRTILEPPAASAVYELTDDGEALRPAVFELIRWGGRFLMPQRPGERVEPDWMRLAMAACAGKRPVPDRSFEVRIPAEPKDVVISVRGGLNGTSISRGPAPADVTITTDARTLLALMAGVIDPSQALGEGLIQAEGDLAELSVFPKLFDTARKETAP